MNKPAARTSPWLWILLILGGLLLFLLLALAGLIGLALMDEDEANADGEAAVLSQQDSPAARAGRPGATGGFVLPLPAGYAGNGQGRYLYAQPDGTARLTVELIRLPALPGTANPAERLATLWTGTIAQDWDGTTPTPLVLRRYVGNGARAWYTGGQLRARPSGLVFYVSLYLVEAGDRLEPVVFLQGYEDPSGFISTRDMMAGLSWPGSYDAAIEPTLRAMQGSPVGLALFQPSELAGSWVHSSNSTAQWVNTVTGSTSMSTVAYAVYYVFGGDGRYSYRFQGASGMVGALQFGGEDARGQWRIEDDQLLLGADSGKQRRYLILSAATAPDGRRTLLLMSEGRYVFAPFAIAAGEMFVAE
jgi:hypothetical protein